MVTHNCNAVHEIFFLPSGVPSWSHVTVMPYMEFFLTFRSTVMVTRSCNAVHEIFPYLPEYCHGHT